MYRAILPDGNLTCETFDRGDNGVEIYTEEDELKAFIPYQNLIAIMNEEVQDERNRAIL